MTQRRTATKEVKEEHAGPVFLPLTAEELKSLYNEYVDEGGMKNLTICSRADREKRMKVNAKAHFMFTRKVWTPDFQRGGYSIYWPEGKSSEQTKDDLSRAEFHWENFEEYFKKRYFAEGKQNEKWTEFAQIPMGNIGN